MMLGSVQLSDNLVLTGLDSGDQVAYSQRRTLTGTSVVQAAPSPGGRELVLHSDNHLTLADVTAVRLLAALGQAVTMVHHRGVYSVLIVNIDVQPAFDHSDPVSDDWYSGTITMIEV